MTIKQQGGIFGRNPTFNDVDVEGTLTVDGEVITSPANNAKLDTANEFTQEQEIKVVDATAYDASAADAQVTVGPSLFLNNPANSNGTVSGQVVFGLRSTPYYARLGATGGSNPNIFVGLGTSEIARFTSSGLAMANGKGIDFSATSGTGTSELFSDYEEGSWTVTVATGSVTGATTAKYIKCGTSVTVWVEGVSFSDTTSAADITIGGLPFTAAQSGQGSIICSYVGASSPNTVNVGGTTVKLYSSFVSGAFSAVQHSAFNSTANQLYFTVTYQST